MKKDEEKPLLTEKEQARLNIFNDRVKDFESKGYKISRLTISGTVANFGSLLLTLPVFAIFAIPYFLLHKDFINVFKNATNVFIAEIILLVVYLALIVVHELIHGITWAIFNPRGFKAIGFGFNKKAFAPYCTCGEPLSRGAYIIGALMPTIILGFIPGIISIVTGSFAFLVISLLLIIGGGGDFLMVILIMRYKKSKDSTEIYFWDHPTEIGSIAIEK